MVAVHNMPLPVAAAALAAIVVCSLPSVRSLVLQLVCGERAAPDTYEDVDGKATSESVRTYSTKGPKIAILLLAAAGCALSIVCVALSAIPSVLVSTYLSVAAWVCLATSPPPPSHFPVQV